MKATASLAPIWPAPATVTLCQKPPRPSLTRHPITQDKAAFELAFAALSDAARKHAISIGMTPERDLVADAFRRQHGQLAALIANPVQEAFVDALTLLYAHSTRLLTPDEAKAMADRIGAYHGHLSRYAADNRQRH